MLVTKKCKCCEIDIKAKSNRHIYCTSCSMVLNKFRSLKNKNGNRV